MLHAILSLRFVMLIASFGAAVGATLLLWEGMAEVFHAALALMAGEDRPLIIASVMHATDAFLFGIVLVTFAYAITFGFVFDQSLPGWDRLPAWMRINNVSELKSTLVEVILLYLLVDFATDLPESHGGSWQMLAKPLSILAIAVAFGVFAALHPPSREK
ncbi:YqhA family protein [Amaricoccus sp.]|uniref:YqhA family protein n=1 Tax=Amaricoccus sp. TaxID=1872485 RepID=UPI002601E619|nr:YqhA family protein [uncultured Amaricoccus sp.]